MDLALNNLETINPTNQPFPTTINVALSANP